jgi:hypothetical protein
MIKQILPGLVIATLACSPAGAQVSASLSPPPQVQSVPVSQSLAAPRSGRANFRDSFPSIEARRMANWVVASADNGSLSFAIIDKKDAKVFVFDDQGQLLGASPVLLGLAVGDDSLPGIGDMPLSAIPRGERTTPAGRFVAFLGRAPGKPNTLWVDYKNAVSLHRVKGLPRDRRLERLASPTPGDNRISFGCINVPVAFFEHTVLPALKDAKAVVYVLPEVKTTRDFFPKYYDVAG